MIIAGQMLLDGGDNRCRIAPGWLRVDGEEIVEVVEEAIPSVYDYGGPTSLITPGLIDAHLHLPQFDMIGAHGQPLLRWLSDFTFPAEIKWSDPDYASSMTRRVAQQLVSKGTTAICAFATVHHQSTRAVIEVTRDFGLRGVIGQVLMDREAPDALCRPADQLLDEANSLGQQFPPEERMAAAVTPRFAISCTEELLRGAGRLAKTQGAMVQTHLAETVNECDYVRKLFGARSYVDVYHDTELIGPRSIFGHGIHLTEADRARLSDCGAVIAHCPTANSFLRSGTMNRAALVSDNVRIAIGSDIGAGYERSMVRVGRAMIEAAAQIGDEFPDASQAWYAITAGNAEALSWNNAGRLKKGSSADLLVVDPVIPWLDSSVDPLSMLMFAWDDRWLSKTLLRGRIVYSS